MKQTISVKEKSEIKGKSKLKNNKAKNGLIFVFLLCFASLFLFFCFGGEEQKYEEGNEIISVFKESYLYDFLDLDKCGNDENTLGSV